jgi:hypothetical protein
MGGIVLLVIVGAVVFLLLVLARCYGGVQKQPRGHRSDGRVTPNEADLLRAICTALPCPLPSILPGAETA